MKTRTVALLFFLGALVLDYGVATLLLGHFEYWKPLGLILCTLLGVTYLSFKAYRASRKVYIAFVGSEQAWRTAKYEMRYTKMKWIHKVDDLNGELFTGSYCSEQHIRRYKILYDAVLEYIAYTKGR